MKKTRKYLLIMIKEKLKNKNLSSGEMCTELLKLEKMSLNGLSFYLSQLEED
jgi:hypothetical protein